jgi:serine/threonine-protein kinase RsbW
MLVSKPQPEHVLKATLASCLTSYQDFIETAKETLAGLGWEKSDLFGVEMALEESISNAIRHGNKECSEKVVQIECRLSASQFWAQVRDEGTGFKPSAVPDCCSPDRLEVPGGRGLTLMQGFMDDVAYNECGNCVTMVKHRSPAAD